MITFNNNIYTVVTNKKTFSLPKDQVEQLYRLYPTSGAGLSVREICSTYLTNYLTDELQQIIKSFREAYKDTYPLIKSGNIFAPHEWEEDTEDTLYKKKVAFTSRLHKLRLQSQENKNRQNLIAELQAKLNDRDEFVKQLNNVIKDNNTDYYTSTRVEGNRSLAIWLSDMHIGCRVDASGAVMNENIGWNPDTVKSRLQKVIDRITSAGPFKNIYLFNLGDALDGMDATTTRRDVSLPQSMSNSDMINHYIKIILWFVNSLKHNHCAKNYYFRSVGESNHGGSAEYAANVAVASILESQGVNSYVCNKSIGFTMIDSIPVMYLHGKDNTNQRTPLGATLSNKDILYLSDVIQSNGLSEYRGRILVVKGDSHQAALTACNDFEYKSVGSLFGGSMWAQANFALRRWEVNMSIFENGERMDLSVKEPFTPPKAEFI